MDKIELFRELLNSFSEGAYQVVRGEELSKTPKYPYIEMFVLNIVPDFHTQSEEVIERITEDAETYLIQENEKFEFATLQMNCRHKSNLEAQQLAHDLFILINYTKNDELLNNEIGVRNMSMIRNLNYFEGGKYSYCYTFDVELSYSIVDRKKIEDIEKVRIKVKDEIIEEDA